jgi:hypothetical protein
MTLEVYENTTMNGGIRLSLSLPRMEGGIPKVYARTLGDLKKYP